MDISRSVDNSLDITVEFLKELIKIDTQQGKPIIILDMQKLEKEKN